MVVVGSLGFVVLNVEFFWNSSAFLVLLGSIFNGGDLRSSLMTM